MTKKTKLVDNFAKVSENYTITNCQNGYVIEVSGYDKANEWIAIKYVLQTIEELKDVVQDLAWIQKA